MKAATLSISVAATQTDPWSEDCCLSQFGDDYEDINGDLSSEHIYQLHAECAMPSVDPLYDYLLSAGGSETDDDGYEVIGDVDSDENVDVMRSRAYSKQHDSMNSALWKQPQAFNTDENTSVPASGNPVGLVPSEVRTPASGSISSFVPSQCDAADGQQSVIRLGVESCRDKRKMPLPPLPSPPPVDNSRSTDSSNTTCRGRLVPTMGTRLKTARHQAATSGDVHKSATDRLRTNQLRCPAAPIHHEVLWSSDGERNSPSTDLWSSCYVRAWSSDGDSRDVDRLAASSSSDNYSASDVSLDSVCVSTERKVSLTSPAPTPDRCSSPTTAADVAEIISPIDVRQLVDERALEGSSPNQTSSTRRRFIYEHYADVMYTNQANLAHTIMVQQRLYQQLLADLTTSAGVGCLGANIGDNVVELSPSSLHIDAERLTKPRRHGRSKLAADDRRESVRIDQADSNVNKWVVKRRKDGTRYVTRSRHDKGDMKAEAGRLLPAYNSGDSVDLKTDKWQQHITKHPRVVTSSGKEHISSVALSRDEKSKVENQCSRVGVELSSRTTNKTGQHHPILSVVTI